MRKLYQKILNSWEILKNAKIQGRLPSIEEVRRRHNREPTLREQRELDLMYKLRRYWGS